MAKKKGAMTKSPSTLKTQSSGKLNDRVKDLGLRRLSPGVYRNIEGKLTNSRGQLIDSKGRVIRKVPGTQPTQPTSFDKTGQNVVNALNQQLQFLQTQGRFQPGDFNQQTEQAYNNVMQNFERTMGPQFAKEQAEFRQLAAERGLDPNSEAYRSLQQQINQSQESQRQAAMNAAQNASKDVQQQAFNQAVTQYQMPANLLAAYAPLYGTTEEQQRFAQQLGWDQAKLQQQGQQALQQIRLQGHMQHNDPNAMTFEQRLQYLDRQMANEAAIRGLQPQQKQPSMGNAFVSGAASGIGSTIMGG
ncbi:MAG: hypothetical protein EBX40_04870 [Gammaproteobacteria bacterium]|nr:hypothetical protein [Gammaproteobacteria bacterium]